MISYDRYKPDLIVHFQDKHRDHTACQNKKQHIYHGSHNIISDFPSRMYQLSYKNIKNKNYLSRKYPAVPLGRFADLPFIMLTQGNDTRTRGDRLCRNVGFKPNIVLEFNQQSTAYMASSTQLGATFISDILVSQLPTFENLVYYKLDGEEAKRKVFFYYKTHKYKTRVMEEFIRMMHEQI